jgi:23S rRNA maturation mini-RNase III
MPPFEQDRVWRAVPPLACDIAERISEIVMVYLGDHVYNHRVKRRIARTVFARLRADRAHALIADLERRSNEWANRLPASTPRARARGTGERTASATTSFAATPLTAELARINDEWADALTR